MTTTRDNDTTRPLFDPVKVVATIKMLHEPGAVFELRALGVKLRAQRFRNYRALSGFFDLPDALAKQLQQIVSATGIYVTLNPLNPVLLNRAINRINGDATQDFAAKDGDIIRRRWLLIDCDPVRPKGVSATDDELSKAKECSKAIHAFLKEKGWSQPICALSGNGVHLLYRVDLPSDDAELLKRVLLALSQKFDDGVVDVDKSVHNPSRIVKLYGTLACKGDHSPERPYRMSEIVKVPNEMGVVTKEQLESVASLVAGEKQPAIKSISAVKTRTIHSNKVKGWDAHAFVAEFVAKHGIQVARMENKNGDTYHMLDICPWANEHGGEDKPGDAAIVVAASGELGFKCFHSHCANRHWRDFRLKFEPDFDRRKQDSTRYHQDNGRLVPADVLNGESDGLRAVFFNILHRDGIKVNEKYAEMAAATVNVLHGRGRFFHHSERKDFENTMYFDGRRKLLSMISGDDFQAWLSGFSGLNLSEPAFQYVLSACKQEALAGKTTGIIPSAYWHGTSAAIYISNGDGHAVKITAGKREVVDNGTDDVLFAAGKTLNPWKLVEPADPFENCKVFSDAATTPNGRELLRLWTLSLPTGQRCKPPMVLTGTIGGGKTRIAVGIFELFGIPARIVALAENGEDDFWTQLDSGGLCCYDNADTRLKWLADALSAAATDGSHEKRRLYTDGTIVRQHSRSWIIVTSANPTFASDAGLADRILVTRLERRVRETAETALSREVEGHRNAGLSWIADTLSKALADETPVRNGNLNRRHPDFAEFAVRLGRAIGREAQAIATLQSAEADKSRFNLENDEVGSALIELGDWQGTAQELLEALIAIDAGFDGKWSAKRLGKRIAKLWTHLEGDLQASKETEGHSKKTVYHFSKPAGFAGYQDTLSGKVPIYSSQGGFKENASRNPANPATSPFETATMTSIFASANQPVGYAGDQTALQTNSPREALVGTLSETARNPPHNPQTEILLPPATTGTDSSDDDADKPASLFGLPLDPDDKFLSDE